MEAASTVAGKYRLNRLLGEGGMATVWSATNVFTEREFAIKFMLPQVARTPDAARRFLLEARVSARINHPNIIEVIDVGQAEDGSLFLVMELLSGVSLDVAIRRTTPPMPVRDFIGVMRDVAEALAAAHKSGVIHRDLKPTNVFLHRDRDGRVVPKLLDFGVSKILEDNQKNTSLTVAGTVLGSPLYMSPEQARGETDTLDGRTDVFAYGSILFEALTAQRAFDGANFNALIVAIATTEPKSIDDVAPQLPPALRALVSDCMAPDREARLASFDLVVERVDAMREALDACEQCLPSESGNGASDPDATHALPVVRTDRVRTSDRPPAAPAPGPVGHPSWPAMQITQASRTQAVPLVAIGAGAALVAALVAVLLVVAVTHTRSSATTGEAAGGATTATAAVLAPRATASAAAAAGSVSASVPEISVDSLPAAPATALRPHR